MIRYDTSDDGLKLMMEEALSSSPILKDAPFAYSADKGKIHANSFGPYGQTLLNYIGSDALYIAFYYSREQTWLSVMVSLGKSRSSVEKDNAISYCFGKLNGQYRYFDRTYQDSIGGSSFSFSADDVPDSEYPERLKKMVKDVEDVLKATVNPAYYQ